MEKASTKIIHQKKMNEFIDLIEKIEESGIKDYIELPKFCILGDKYCEKSSIIENILNLDFLPLNWDFLLNKKLKKPVIIKITHIKDNNQTYATLGELNTLKKYYDFTELKLELAKMVDNYMNSEKKALNINIYSPNLPSITIIDLPPILRKYTNASFMSYIFFIYSYIISKSSIILCVIPANSYYYANDILKKVKDADSEGKRTLGVITKIDEMDEGYNCSKLLINQEIPLNLGYVGVLNRTKSEMEKNMSLEEKYDKEKMFFNNDEIYSKVPSHLLGHENIIEKMKKIYFMNVKNNIIDIFVKLEKNKNIENVDAIIDSLKENDNLDEFLKIFKENKKIIDDNKHLIKVI